MCTSTLLLSLVVYLSIFVFYMSVFSPIGSPGRSAGHLGEQRLPGPGTEGRQER